MRGQHQQLRLQDGRVAQGDVHRHLVPVEVGVEGRGDEGVQLDRLAFHQFGLECLDGKTVQRRSTVQHDRMTLQYILEDIPYDGFLAVHQFPGGFHRFHDTPLDQLTNDEWLEQLGSHILGKTALVQFQLGAYHDHGTAGIVHTLTQEVLTETTLLAFQYIGE